MFFSVDFPDPLAPTFAAYCPVGMRIVMSDSTGSGGEPLRQMEFLTAFFELARSKGVHTALDTAGQPFCPDDAAYLADCDRLMKSSSLVILD